MRPPVGEARALVVVIARRDADDVLRRSEGLLIGIRSECAAGRVVRAERIRVVEAARVVPLRVVRRVDVVRTVPAGGDEKDVCVARFADFIEQSRVVRKLPGARAHRVAATVRVAENAYVGALRVRNDPGRRIAVVPNPLRLHRVVDRLDRLRGVPAQAGVLIPAQAHEAHAPVDARPAGGVVSLRSDDTAGHRAVPRRRGWIVGVAHVPYRIPPVRARRAGRVRVDDAAAVRERVLEVERLRIRPDIRSEVRVVVVDAAVDNANDRR